VIIKKAKSKDMNEVINLFTESFSEAPFNERWNKANAIKKIKQYRKSGIINIAIDNNLIIGFIMYHYTIWDTCLHLFIDELGVKKEYRKKGIATILIRYAEKDAKNKNVRIIELIANKESNAFRLYKKLDYKETHAIVMEKHI